MSGAIPPPASPPPICHPGTVCPGQITSPLPDSPLDAAHCYVTLGDRCIRRDAPGVDVDGPAVVLDVGVPPCGTPEAALAGVCFAWKVVDCRWGEDWVPSSRPIGCYWATKMEPAQ